MSPLLFLPLIGYTVILCNLHNMDAIDIAQAQEEWFRDQRIAKARQKSTLILTHVSWSLWKESLAMVAAALLKRLVKRLAHHHVRLSA